MLIEGLSNITFVNGILRVECTSIDPSVVDKDGVYRQRGPVKIYTTERAAVAALKAQQIHAGDVMVLLSCGPMGTGMEEIAQVTTALKYLDFGKEVAVLTDARFSGFSTGACIGHIGPEALAGGPLGKLIEGDIVEIEVDRKQLHGQVNLIGHLDEIFGAAAGADILTARLSRPDLAEEEELPDDTRLWAALQNVSGGTWGGCVYDVDAIIKTLAAGQEALAEKEQEIPHG